jgi:hypothetical protein
VRGVFRAGASAVDVSPAKLPVRVNGGFLEAKSDAVRDPLYARALVLDDGVTRLAIVVVDNCMMPRQLLDQAKALARQRTGLPVERILISATHTHSAPAAMGALGCRPDPAYVAFLPDRIVDAISQAVANLKPAQVGWSSIDDPEHTHCRRWIRRPDKLITDPFGRASARAHMHPGYQNPDAISPSGPVDPELSVLGVRTSLGRPLAVLANYSMHYFGADAVSADYFGRFATAFWKQLGGIREGEPPFVVMMSQGTSGDQHWMDYGRPKTSIKIDEYAEAVAAVALRAYRNIEYRDWVPLNMAETRLTLGRRKPDPARLAWARSVVATMGDRPPRTLAEVYAKEALSLFEEPQRELKLQAIRVGELGIAAIPDEVFALTGLKIKARSPFRSTFMIELANGSEGYIPPPEQHALGGYTTWPARTAALEVQAEPKIVESVLGLLEKVAGTSRRQSQIVATPYSRAVLEGRPWAYWRLEEMEGATAFDATGRERRGHLERGYALYLDGPESPSTGTTEKSTRPQNHAVYLAGGRITIQGRIPTTHSSVVLWFWNGLPADLRPMTGILLERGKSAVQVGIGGTQSGRGRLFVKGEDLAAPSKTGSTEVGTKTWHHLALIQEGTRMAVYLDGREDAVLTLPEGKSDASSLNVGGGDDPGNGFEGKVDEVTIFDRALSGPEVLALFGAGSSSGR